MTAWVPRASERKRVLWNATLQQNDRSLQCTVCDISAGGAKVRTAERLAIDSKVVLTIDRLGSFPGEIRWQNHDWVGISFLEEASSIEKHLRRASPASSAATDRAAGRR